MPLSIIKVTTPPKGEQVIDHNNATAMLQALEYVVSNAIPKAQIPGYRVGGKSGTAKVAVAGGYGKDYMAWFAGFAPASNPRFVMVVVINEPKGDAYYGGAVATPPFAEAMGGVLQLFNIRPDAIPLRCRRSLPVRRPPMAHLVPDRHPRFSVDPATVGVFPWRPVPERLHSCPFGGFPCCRPAHLINS